MIMLQNVSNHNSTKLLMLMAIITMPFLLPSIVLSAEKPATISNAYKTGSPKNNIVADVEGNTIYIEDMQLQINSLPEYLKPIARTYEGRRELLASMIIREMILKEAANDGSDKSGQVKKPINDETKKIIVRDYIKKYSQNFFEGKDKEALQALKIELKKKYKYTIYDETLNKME